MMCESGVAALGRTMQYCSTVTTDICDVLYLHCHPLEVMSNF